MSKLRRFVVVSATCSVVAMSAGPALSIPTPANPNDPAYEQQWINPDVRSVDSNADYSLEILEVPQTVTVGSTLQMRVRVTNNTDSDLPAGDISVLTQRAEAATSVAQAREIIGGSANRYGYYADPVRLQHTIAAGASAELDVDIPLNSNDSNRLSITAAGSYPIMVSMQSLQSGLLDSQRFVLYVQDPEATETAATADSLADATTEEAESLPVGTQLVIPITASIKIVPGETGTAAQRTPLVLQDDNFVTELNSGGRLEKLLSDYSAAVAANPELSTATCLAIDPQLIDVVDRMREGYFIGSERPEIAETRVRLRDSWGSSNDDVDLTTGANAEVAAAWLAQLQEVVQDSCVVALPWANADLNTVGAINNPWLMKEALQRGPQLLAEVLQVTPQHNIVLPGAGYITPTAVQSLGWANLSADAPNINEQWQNSLEPSDFAGSAANSATALEAQSLQSGTAPSPVEELSVLVSDNSVWSPAQTGRFADLSANVQAVMYSGSLAATLAEVGSTPLTLGYSNANIRYDHTIDSQAARTTTAVAAVYQSVTTATDPVFINLPSLIDDIAPYTQALSQLLEADAATPLTLGDYVHMSAEERETLDELNAQSAAAATSEGQDAAINAEYGAPYVDPTIFADTEVLAASQQATFADNLTRMMIADDAIALTPYEFTAPLRQDLLRALSITQRQSRREFLSNVATTEDILNRNRNTLIALRSSVSLIPPGNVYTRTSASAPLLVAARNGLPLPVDAQLRWIGPEGTELHVRDHIIIPAQGSLTLQITADIPNSSQRTDLQLLLANQEGDAITTPVNISVQTRDGIAGLNTIGIALLGLLSGLLVFRLYKQIHSKRKQSGRTRRHNRAATRVTLKRNKPRK